MNKFEQSGVIDNEIVNKLNQLETISYKDSLTGLWGKNYLSEQIDNIIGGEKNSGTLFVVDIDGFSRINEEFGHIMGDACLVRLAGVLNNSFRDRDITARISGDEFGVFITGNLTYKDVNGISAKLLNSAKEGLASMNLGREITVSIGVARASVNGGDFLSLYKKAEEALRTSKKNGKNDYTIAEEDLSGKKGVDTEADMKVVKNLISERNKPNGAFKVEYEEFKHIFQFISRNSSRQETGIDIILFTISKKDGKMIDPISISEAMFNLENVIKISLRIGDVATKYSSCQYLVMLIGTKEAKTEDIANRVIKNYQTFADKYDIIVKYDIDSDILSKG